MSARYVVFDRLDTLEEVFRTKFDLEVAIINGSHYMKWEVSS